MTTTRLALAGLCSAALLGCAPLTPLEVQTASTLSPRDRVRAWAFSPEVAAPELAPVRDAVAAELRARGWLEAPAEQSEALVRFDLRIGDTRRIEAETGATALLTFLGILGGSEQERSSAVPFDVRSVRLTVQIDPAGDAGAPLFRGVAEKAGQELLAVRSAAPLVRAVFAGFYGGDGEVHQVGVDDRPLRVAQPVLPPPEGRPRRVACPAGVPVLVAAGAPLRGVSHPDGKVRERLPDPASGCASAGAVRGLQRVVLADGRSGYVPVGALAFHPGP